MTTLHIMFLSLLLIATLALAACTSQPQSQQQAQAAAPADAPAESASPAPQGTLYGAELTATPISVTEFLAHPADYDGQTIALEGTLAQVCVSGCWFFLRDPEFAGAGRPPQVYVDLQQGAVFKVPNDIAGKHAIVQGRVAAEGSDYKLVGRGVLVQ